MKGVQIPLSVRLHSAASFQTFYVGPNGPAVEALRAQGQGGLFLYGPSGSGKSHLLQAAVRDAQQQARAVSYLPLRSLQASPAEALDGLVDLDLVCIDDLEVAAEPDWSHALIRLLDRLRTGAGRWCATGSASAERLEQLPPDLRTRLSSVPGFGLRLLGDDDCRQWLHREARQRGLELPEDAARWLINHLPRDTRSLLAALEQLDNASLRDQRRLTLAFLQKTLPSGS